MRFLAKLDAMSTKAIVVLCVFVLWLLIMALALYEFDLSGLRAGLDPGNYHGHQVDYAILGFSLAARHWRPHCSGLAWLKRR